MYAALLFNQANSDVLDKEDDLVFEDDHMLGAPDVNENTMQNVTLKEILRNLSETLTYDEISKFNISRNHIWEGTKRALNRKSFQPRNKISVKFTDNIGASEGAVDLGGPAREFFTLVTEWLVNSQLFFSVETSKFLSLNANCLEEREYYLAGQIFAMSLVHGGPGPKCFAESCYYAIVKETGTQNFHADVNDVPDYELRSSFGRLLKASDAKEATQIINNEKLDVLLDMAGTFQVVKTADDIQNMVQKTVDWYVLGRVQAAYNSFREGLQALGVLEAMKNHPGVFREAFCYTPEILTASSFEALFPDVVRQCDGSNRRLVENLVLSHWRDFLQDTEEDSCALSFSDILFFTTGCKQLPPLGLSCELAFLHDPEDDGKLSKFPKANTCAGILYLPVVHKDYEQFKDAMIFAIPNSRGFGIA